MPGHFPEPGYVVQKCKDPNRDDVTPSSSEGANGSSLEWETDSDVSFNTDTQSQVDASSLSNHSYRIDERRDEGENFEEVESKDPLLGVSVDGWKAKHQDACEEQDSVVSGLNLIGKYFSLIIFFKFSKNMLTELNGSLIQWKLLNVITWGPREPGNINRMITITSFTYTNHCYV